MEKKQCPRCKALIEPMPILYGLPGPEMVLGAQAGKIRLGGCIVEPESPDYVCPECDAALPWVRQPGDEGAEGYQPLAAMRFGVSDPPERDPP